MPNPLARKLGNFTDLPDDRRFLDQVARGAKHVGARQDLIREGEVPDDVHLILSGFACRYKLLPSGRRQIMAYLVPGDFCDMHVFILRAMDHSVATLSGCEVVGIPRPVVLEMTERPAIARALWWATLVDEATLREWLLNIGRRSAEKRVAHLLCELLVRLRTVGLAGDDGYAFPITQEELGDTTGLSTVHVNRTLQALRSQGLVTLDRRSVAIPDVERLFAFSGFTPNYLHLAYRNGGARNGDAKHPA